jgi:diaminopimelate epimerase
MGEPVLNVEDVPTTMEANREGSQAVAVPVEVAGSSWTITAVGMGNPHAVIYSKDGADVVVCSQWATVVMGIQYPGLVR